MHHIITLITKEIKMHHINLTYNVNTTHTLNPKYAAHQYKYKQFFEE